MQHSVGRHARKIFSVTENRNKQSLEKYVYFIKNEISESRGNITNNLYHF